MIAVLATIGWAASPDGRYALRGAVDVADDGPVRIDLDPEWVARCPDPTTYLLVDPEGNEIPYASATSDASPPEREPLTWEPREISPYLWMYVVHPPKSGAPAHALSIRQIPEGWVVRVLVSQKGKVVARSLVWNLPDTGAGIRDEVKLPAEAANGPWEVDLRTVSWGRWRPWAEFEAVTAQVDQVAEVSWPVNVEPPIAVTVAESRLTVPLPRGGLPVRGVRIIAADPVFSRPVVVRDGSGTTIGNRRIERFTIGDEAIDVDRVPIHATPSRALVLDVTDDRSVPLDVQGAEVALRGLALLVPVGVSGEWTVFGCGPAGQAYDVERLSDKLMGRRTPRVRPTAPIPNDLWTAELVTEGVAGPGQPLGAGSTALGRVSGPSGLVRVRLPPEVLAVTDGDLGNLRFTTPAGLQLPFLSDDAGSVPVHGLSWSTAEDGPITVMRIALPLDGLPLEQVVLHAERGRFQRGVEVRDGRRSLARATWYGTGDEVSRLVIPLKGPGPRLLELRIDNGANAPLPLLDPAISMGTSDAWLVLPPDGARVSTASAHVRPRYDLELVRSEVIDGPALPASILPPPPQPAPRPVIAVPPPPAAASPPPYRWATALIGVCALVIGGVTFRLSRSTDQTGEPDRS